MAGPAVGRSRTGRPGETEIAAYACRRSPGASADAGSIPAASTATGSRSAKRRYVRVDSRAAVAEAIARERSRSWSDRVPRDGDLPPTRRKEDAAARARA